MHARFDLYADIHKALRACLCETLVRVGRADPRDDTDVREALAEVRGLLDKCAAHVDKENRYVHPAIEARASGTTTQVAEEHDHHASAIAVLRAEVIAVAAIAPGPRRDTAMLALYRGLARFVADNLEHMHVEETVHNAALWSAYTDPELVAIEQAILAGIPPAEMMDLLPWMIRAVTPASRAQMFTGMRAGMPPPAFEAVTGLARSVLDARNVAKLDAAMQDPAFARVA